MDEALRVTVSDDGCGGAASTPGSGLEGLADRVHALGGQLVIDSPAGGGTVITADIPLALTVISDAARRRMTALEWIGYEQWEMPPEAFEQITDEDNVAAGKAIMLSRGATQGFPPVNGSGSSATSRPRATWTGSSTRSRPTTTPTPSRT